jgi:hypothetical protein
MWSMDLKTYISSLPKERREELAQKCKNTLGHIQNVMYGLRKCDPELASLLEAHTDGAVSRKELLPDNWAVIWPELAPKEVAR